MHLLPQTDLKAVLTGLTNLPKLGPSYSTIYCLPDLLNFANFHPFKKSKWETLVQIAWTHLNINFTVQGQTWEIGGNRCLLL